MNQSSSVPLRLRGVKAKIDRAAEHFNALHEEGMRLLRARPYRSTTYFDPNLRIGYLWIEPTSEHPDILGILLGDVLHNLHLALDHTICELARVTDPSCECASTAFPIFTNQQEYRKRVGRALHGVPDGAKTVIESLQPFSSGRIRTSTFWSCFGSSPISTSIAKSILQSQE